MTAADDPDEYGHDFCLAFAKANAMAPIGWGARGDAWLDGTGPRPRESRTAPLPACVAPVGRLAESSRRIVKAIR